MTAQSIDVHAARDRLQRTIYTGCGIASSVFSLTLIGKILSQFDELNDVYALIALAFGIILPASMAVLARVLPIRALNAYAGIVVAGFVLCQLAWPLAMTVDATASEPWLQGINAVHGTMVAVLLRSRWAWAYPLAQGLIVTVIENISTGGVDPKHAILDGLGAVVFCGILVGAGLALISAASKQDLSAARARAQASLEASKRTRQREQARINGIVHDDIISVLLVASREDHSPRVAEKAEAALTSIATLALDDEDTPDYSPEDTIIALRSAVTDYASQVAFWHSSVGRRPIPSKVVESFSESIGEAVRNSLRYADHEDGSFVHRVVTVNLTDNTMRATIQDTGRGFSPKAVPQRRLGIRVSIFERMRLLEGGDAQLDSRQGRGTTVTLTWMRPS